MPSGDTANGNKISHFRLETCTKTMIYHITWCTIRYLHGMIVGP